MSHRSAVRRFCQAVIASAVVLLPVMAQAAAPAQKTQPGYYRLMLGAFEVTALSDGTIDLPVENLLRTGRKRTLTALGRAGLPSPVETSVNAYLVNTGSRLILIDVGCGNLFGPRVGHLIASLRAAGHAPEQIDEIWLTHLHADHAGGLAGPEGQRQFPNAVVRVEQKDAEFWLSEQKMAAAPESMRDFFRAAMKSVAPYQTDGRLKTFSGATELAPGLRAAPAPGHTPGHTVYYVESEGKRMVLWGDVMHVAAVQFADPSVTITFDTDPRAAAISRRKVFAEVAQQRLLVGGAHLSFPGLGSLRAEGKGYVFLPLNYGLPR